MVKTQLQWLPLRVLVLVLGFITVGCGSDSTDNNNDDGGGDFTLLATAETSALVVEMHTKGPLEVGRNEVAYRILDKANGSALITTADITQQPTMEMTDHSHTCPLTNPGQNADDDGFFMGSIVFNMPSMDGTWTLWVKVNAAGVDEDMDFG